MTNNLKESLEIIIKMAKDRKLIPFIGSGFSKNLNIPTWEEVINNIAEDVGWSPEIMKSQGDFMQIAEYCVQVGGISGLRSKLDKVFNSNKIDITKSKLHSTLIKIDAPIIYTTNWDNWIEESYKKNNKDCQVVRKLSDILNIHNSKTQIVKFHGDFESNDKDIVFSESTYFDRMKFESFLDIKFRADILGKCILFLGYSFSDINIRMLWHELHKLIYKFKQDNNMPDYPKSYIVLNRPNLLLSEIYKNKNITILTLEGKKNAGIELTNFLNSIVNGMGK